MYLLVWLYWQVHRLFSAVAKETRKLSYRKDDRAMRPIYGCPKKFREPLNMRTATFPEIFNGLLFRLMLWIYVENLKFVALPVPEIIGASKKWAVPGYARAPFSPKFLTGFCSDGPRDVPAKCEVRSFTRSRDYIDWSFGVGLRSPNLGKRRP